MGRNKALLQSALSIIGVFGLSATAYATVSTPQTQTFTYQGQLLDSGNGSPLSGTITLALSIYDPTGVCLLYQESQNVDVTTTKGMFSVQVGSATTSTPPSGKRTTSDPGLTMFDIFVNDGVLLRANDSGTTNTCPGGYTPQPMDARKLRVVVTYGANTYQLSPDETIDSTPQAWVAETLQGYEPSDFLHSDGSNTGSSISVTGNVSAGGVVSSAGGIMVNGSLVIGPSGQWLGAGGMTGATGPAGAVGPSGSVGATGAAGPTGTAGATGAQGSAGPTGAAGAAGPTGATGATGVAGATGSAGAAGPTGAAGATGASPWLLSGSNTYYNAGNVGIGTSSPAAALDVESTTGVTIGSGPLNLSSGQSVMFGSSAYSYINGGDGSGSYLSFGTSGTSAMNINQTQQVAIGTTSHDNTLDVYGNAAIGTFAGNDAAPSNSLIVSGNVGIGMTSPGVSLDVNGGVRAGSSTTVTTCGSGAANGEGTQRYNFTTHNMEYCNGSSWVGSGTSGNQLALISTQTASASASIQFTNLPTIYNTLFLNCAGILMSTNAVAMIRIGEGATPTWESGAHYVSSVLWLEPTGSGSYGGTTATDILDGGDAILGSFPQSIKLYIDNVSSSSLYKNYTYTYLGYDNTDNVGFENEGGGYWSNDTNPITGIELLLSTGTISSGTCSLYGLN
jgi:hypothetical protein